MASVVFMGGYEVPSIYTVGGPGAAVRPLSGVSFTMTCVTGGASGVTVFLGYQLSGYSQ